ncbi:MAG TPA: hypothetical protein DCF68_07725 [Cyanothece sp. UBA12306]|nr:hypothetical protein [Cyanothece sp. UBA12306]
MAKKNSNQAKSEPPIISSLTINFVFQFLIGLGLALILAHVLSGIEQNLSSYTLIGLGPLKLTINSLVLNLVIGGSLGGLLYSMLVDQVLEFPRFTKNEPGLKLGIIGDIITGVAGAIIAYFVITRSPNSQNSVILTFVAALVGGYGGKTLLEAVLKRFITQVQTVNLQEVLEKKQELARKQQVKDIQRLANQQIKKGLESWELSELTTNLQKGDKIVKDRVFAAAREARRLGARVKAYSDRINRTIPIFESLVKSDPTDDRYQAQLGCALRDALPPDLDQAIDKLTEAIDLRQPTSDDNWHYELDRAVALIDKSETESDADRQYSSLAQRIFADLKTIDKNHGLNRIALEFDEGKKVPIATWLTNNQAWLKNNPEGSQLVKKGLNAIPLDQPIIPSINIDDFQWENAPENSTIKAITATYLKKQPIQSSELPKNQKKFMPVGEECKFLRYAKLNAAETDNQQPQNTPITPLQTSTIPQSGLDVIKRFEGYHKELADGRAQAYPDPGPKGWNLPTIGYGTTKYPDGQSVKRGDIITHQEAEQYLLHYVDKKCRKALEKIPTWSQMNDNQRGALYSFAYNLGEHFYQGNGFQSITRVCDSPERWNDQTWIEQQFGKYVKADGKTLPGLVTRRKAEAQLFCAPVTSNTPIKSNTNNLSPVSEVTSAHCVVELDYGQGTWYIWSNHWDLPWVKQTQPKDKEKIVLSPGKYNNPKAVQRQIDRISKYLPAGQVLDLDVKTKYFSQRDNYRDKDRTCNSSSNAMYLDWLRRVTGKPGLDNDNEYLKKVYTKHGSKYHLNRRFGVDAHHNVQTWALEQYGFKTQWMTDRDLPFIKDLIAIGFPVVVNIRHRGSISNPTGNGHVLMLIGRKDNYWIAHDPYGTLKSNYRDRNGKYSQISEHEFKKRWQGCYRTLRD